jgi:hypothetical protein
MRVDRLPGNFVRRTKIRATAPPIGNEPPAHRLAARSSIAISRSCCYSTKWLHSHRSQSRLIGRVSYRNFLGAFRRGGHYHTQAWDMGQHSLGGLGVMLGGTNAGVMRRAQNHGTAQPSLRSPAKTGGMVQKGSPGTACRGAGWLAIVYRVRRSFRTDGRGTRSDRDQIRVRTRSGGGQIHGRGIRSRGDQIHGRTRSPCRSRSCRSRPFRSRLRQSGPRQRRPHLRRHPHLRREWPTRPYLHREWPTHSTSSRLWRSPRRPDQSLSCAS